MARDICPGLAVRSAEIISGQRFSSRLPGEERGRVTVRLALELTVESDYFFIGAGMESLREIEDLVRKRRDLLRLPPDRLVSSARSLVRGAGLVKDFFRVFNPYTGRVQPAIPGSSLKGAARSRLELASSGERVVAGFLYPGPDVGPLNSLPPRGRHGWRHARIWCESVAEVRRKTGENSISVEDDLFGITADPFPMSSRVFFGTLYPIDPGLDCEVVDLDHGERVCAVSMGAVFRGEVTVVNVSMEELGLLFYSLGLDKMLCSKKPLLLMGSSKYRCRTTREGVKVSFGIVEVTVEAMEVAPWSKWLEGGVGEVVRASLEKAFEAYPGLRRCFNEAERKHLLEPC